MNKEDYSKDLNHPLWQKKRDEVFLKYGRKCSEPNCDCVKNLEIHHKTYSPGKRPWEYPVENFEVLCEKHHKIHHGHEYTFNKCKGKDSEGKVYGIKISPKYDYCFRCHKKLIEDKETEKKKLEDKIADLENSLKKEENNKNRSSNQEVDRLKRELNQLINNRNNAERIIAELKRMDEFKEEVRTNNQRIESKINLLIKILGIVAAIILIVVFISWNTKENEKNVQAPVQKEIVPADKKEELSDKNAISNVPKNLKNDTTDNKKANPSISEKSV
jgi:hypothetical protein